MSDLEDLREQLAAAEREARRLGGLYIEAARTGSLAEYDRAQRAWAEQHVRVARLAAEVSRAKKEQARG